MPAETKKKTCFVIAPIGDAESDIRKRSDIILEFLISATVDPIGYAVTRADKISEPGVITTQIIQHIIDDDLVIADLSGQNPNVFYELAVRHAFRKPFIQIICRGEKIPFDVAGVRTIEVDHHDLKSVDEAKKEMTRQIRTMETSTKDLESPISVSIDLDKLRHSGKSIDRQIADIFSALSMQNKVLMFIQESLISFERRQMSNAFRNYALSESSRQGRSVISPNLQKKMDDLERRLVQVSAADTADNYKEEIESIQEEISLLKNITLEANQLISTKIVENDSRHPVKTKDKTGGQPDLDGPI